MLEKKMIQIQDKEVKIIKYPQPEINDLIKYYYI